MKTVVYRVLAQVFGVIALAVGVFALVAGLYAHSYVSDQLSQEKITMPAAAAYKTLPQASQDALAPFAGQPMVTGDAAQAFANNYIWEHMVAGCSAVKDANGNAVPAVPADKCTYSGVGGVVSATTDANQKAAYSALRNTLFQGDTLRTSLLTAYAFWLIGTIAAWIGAIALVLGAAFVLLSFTVLKAKGEAAAAVSAGAKQNVAVS
ncbi:MAG: hypothetical protein HY829_02205 [Actinobacteria bacterium]|nr:hypothetical protein [Actinomycetota bacterium]